MSLLQERTSFKVSLLNEMQTLILDKRQVSLCLVCLVVQSILDLVDVC